MELCAHMIQRRDTDKHISVGLVVVAVLHQAGASSVRWVYTTALGAPVVPEEK